MYYYSMILGDSDVVVVYKWGQLSSQYLSSLNPDNYQFKTYAGLGHSSCAEVSLINSFHTV